MKNTEIKVMASGMEAKPNKNPVGTYAMGIETEMPDDATMKKVRETWKSLLETVDNMMKTAKKTQRQTHSLMVCIDFMKAINLYLLAEINLYKQIEAWDKYYDLTLEYSVEKQ